MTVFVINNNITTNINYIASKALESHALTKRDVNRKKIRKKLSTVLFYFPLNIL